MAFRRIKLLFTAGALVLSQSICYAHDYIAEGMVFYNGGDYEKAAQYFYTSAQLTPQDAAARYHLANCLVKLGRASEAQIQYKAAISLKPDGPFADYSRQALLVFKGENAAAAATKSHDQLRAVHEIPAPTRSEQDEEREGERATKAVDSQTSAKESAISDEGAKQVKRIMHEAALQIAALETEKQAEIANVTGTLRRAFKDEVTKPIEQDYKNRIDSVHKEAKKKSDEVLADCRARIAALETSATNSSQAMIDKKRNGTVHSVPLASNLHVHNYESEDQPSGDLVPSIAPPAKSLKSTAKTDQPNQK